MLEREKIHFLCCVLASLLRELTAGCTEQRKWILCHLSAFLKSFLVFISIFLHYIRKSEG